MNRITRRFEIDAGHRVHEHEGQCRHAHGHRYVIDVTVEGRSLDSVGRLIDFSVMKDAFGKFLAEKYDHAFIVWRLDDEMVRALGCVDGQKVAYVRENPTIENLVQTWFEELQTLASVREMPCRVAKVVAYETPNCWAEAVA